MGRKRREKHRVMRKLMVLKDILTVFIVMVSLMYNT